MGISSPHVPMRSGDPEYGMKYRVSHGKLFFFKLALRDRNRQVRFFWKVVLKLKKKQFAMADPVR